jgi:hypothetical protein
MLRSHQFTDGVALPPALIVGGACNPTSPRATQAVLLLLNVNAASQNGSQAAGEVEITLPVSSWFASSGTPLDPSDAAARVQITATARAVAVEGEPAKEGMEE